MKVSTLYVTFSIAVTVEAFAARKLFVSTRLTPPSAPPRNTYFCRDLSLSREQLRLFTIRQKTCLNACSQSDHVHGGVIKSSQSIRDYLSAMRPVTIVQAVGAFLVGRLVVLLSHGTNASSSSSAIIQEFPSLFMASVSIYLSYGAGMAMNDCADASVDLQHGAKQNRSIASGTALSIVSIIFATFAELSCYTKNDQLFVGGSFLGWNVLNLLIMASYALGMQKIFLIKNLLCGWLAVSPLVGASFLGGKQLLGNASAIKLYQLAAIGFPLQVSREILKDIEDVDIDRGKKQTLPLFIGKLKSKWIAYGLVATINMAMVFLPHYWRIFASSPPVYAISVFAGVPMCIRASILPLERGQKLLKKSIYVLLAGMISALLLQAR